MSIPWFCGDLGFGSIGPLKAVAQPYTGISVNPRKIREDPTMFLEETRLLLWEYVSPNESRRWDVPLTRGSEDSGRMAQTFLRWNNENAAYKYWNENTVAYRYLHRPPNRKIEGPYWPRDSWLYIHIHIIYQCFRM